MRSPEMKYKGLKPLTVLAFVITACAIAVAENGIEDSNGVSTTTVAGPDVNSTVNKDSNWVPTTTVTRPDMNSTVNKDSNEDSTTLEQRLQKTISVDFIGTPIEDVLKMITEQANVDFIKSPTVTGNVTATLTNVPLREALNNILAVNGYGCVIDKSMVRIVPISEITQQEERTETKVYHITYAEVGEIESALKKIVSKRGSITSSKGTSDIIVKDIESNIKAIDDFIAKIDRVTPQVLVEVRIYDITSTEGFDIGADWSAGRNNPINVFSTNTTADSIAINNLTGLTTTDTTNINTTKTTQTNWQTNGAGGVTGANSYLYRKSKPFVGGDFASLTGGTIRLGLLDTINVEFALTVLRTEVGAKLLANPRILVLDNETAEFKITTQIPYTEVSTTGNTATETVKFKDIGVDLKVIPHVTRDGMVRLDISPEFGVRVGSTTPPTVDSRKVNTKALVKDGQTVVLGGLRKREVSQDISKIPILGDIPILGGLFSDVEEEVVTSELLIFITPKIIEEPVLSQDELNGYEATNFGGPKVTYTGGEK